eukprot:3840301-Prymnesium_polylepis.3
MRPARAPGRAGGRPARQQGRAVCCRECGGWQRYAAAGSESGEAVRRDRSGRLQLKGLGVDRRTASPSAARRTRGVGREEKTETWGCVVARSGKRLLHCVPGSLAQPSSLFTFGSVGCLVSVWRRGRRRRAQRGESCGHADKCAANGSFSSSTEAFETGQLLS